MTNVEGPNMRQELLNYIAPAIVSIGILLSASNAHSQAVFVGIIGSRCEFSTAVSDAKNPGFVDSKKYWASGFLDGAHAALKIAAVKSSVNFIYARLQNYCAQHPEDTLRDAMMALLAEDRRSDSSAAFSSGTGSDAAVLARIPVEHDHFSDGKFQQYCRGELLFSDTGVQFRSQNSSENWSIPIANANIVAVTPGVFRLNGQTFRRAAESEP